MIYQIFKFKLRKCVTLSAKSSLILGENKAAFAGRVTLIIGGNCVSDFFSTISCLNCDIYKFGNPER